MTARLIQPVDDNKDKQRTYQRMLSRYRLAMKDGFYLEAILIDYAMMEDRLRSFIYYIGGLPDRNSISVKGKAKNKIRQMVLDYDPKGNLGISSISGKRRIVKAVLNWKVTSMCTDDDDYLKALRADIEKLDVDGFLEILDAIESWCHYRNECIHSIMNKNIDSIGEEIAKKAEEGMTYARFVDSQVKLLKKKNLSRRALRLGNK